MRTFSFVTSVLLFAQSAAFVPRATLPLRHNRHATLQRVQQSQRRAVASRTTPTAFIF